MIFFGDAIYYPYICIDNSKQWGEFSTLRITKKDPT
jgi:hypothetical protein